MDRGGYQHPVSEIKKVGRVVYAVVHHPHLRKQVHQRLFKGKTYETYQIAFGKPKDECERVFSYEPMAWFCKHVIRELPRILERQPEQGTLQFTG